MKWILLGIGADSISELSNSIVTNLIIIMVGALIFLIAYSIYFHKDTKRATPQRRDPNEYVSTRGVITDVKKVEYDVVKYSKELSELRRKEKEKPKDKLVGGLTTKEKYLSSPQAVRKAADNMRKKGLTEDSVVDDDHNVYKVELVEKVRYDVKYEFSIPTTSGVSEVYRSEFSVYELTDDIEKGKPVEVMYKIDRPMANYTVHNSPIGRI